MLTATSRGIRAHLGVRTAHLADPSPNDYEHLIAVWNMKKGLPGVAVQHPAVQRLQEVCRVRGLSDSGSFNLLAARVRHYMCRQRLTGLTRCFCAAMCDQYAPCVLRELRRRELQEALKERGCELRSDSRLCDEYVNGSTTKSLEQVWLAGVDFKLLYPALPLKRTLNDLHRQLLV